jgi:hypothetical protein
VLLDKLLWSRYEPRDVKEINAWFVLLAGGAFLVSAILLLGSFDNPSDAEISQSAPEDILGFGFVFTWLFFALPEFFLLSGASLLVTTEKQRAVVIMLGVAFVATSVLFYFKYQQLEARVLG